MKKLLLLFTGLALCQLSAKAKDISPTQAKAIAAKYIKVGAKQNARQFRAFSTASSKTPDYYAFNDTEGKGFVLVAGDDQVTPVLGYSTTGTFDYDNMPSALKKWLEAVSADIETLRKNNVERKQATSSNEDAATVVVAPLLKTTWDQKAPYYDQAPTVNGDRSLTGCVATAMAQVMNYYQWPATGTGSIKYETPDYDSKTMEIDFSKSTYDWNNMLDNYTTTTDGTPQWNEAQGKAVSTLMRDLGTAVHMMYAPKESSAYTTDIANAAILYFGYHATLYDKDDYTTQEWMNIIKQNLDAKNPLLYGGTDASVGGGHQFVVDGYDSNDYLHVNWGWSGKGDGYFTFADFGTNSYNFNYGMQMNLITPNKSGTPAVEQQIRAHAFFTLKNGETTTNKIEAKKDEFEATIGVEMIKPSYYTFNGDVRCIIKDSQGNQVLAWGQYPLQTDKEEDKTTYVQLTSKELSGLNDGTYRITAEWNDTRLDGKRFDDWAECFGDCVVTLILKNGNVTITCQRPNQGAFVVKDFQIDNNAEFGQYLHWKVNLAALTEEDLIFKQLYLKLQKKDSPNSKPIYVDKVDASAFTHLDNIYDRKVPVITNIKHPLGGPQVLTEGQYEVTLMHIPSTSDNKEVSEDELTPLDLPNGPFYINIIDNPDHLARAYVNSMKAYLVYGNDYDDTEELIPCTISKDNVIDIDVTKDFYDLRIDLDIKWTKPSVELAEYETAFTIHEDEFGLVFGRTYYENYKEGIGIFKLMFGQEGFNSDEYGTTLTWKASYSTPNKLATITETLKDKEGNPFTFKTNLTNGETGIRNITAEDSKKVYFDLQGNRHYSPVKGLNIIHTSNGDTKKIIRK